MTINLEAYQADGVVPQASLCDYVRYLEALRAGLYVALHRCRITADPGAPVVLDLFEIVDCLNLEVYRVLMTEGSYLLPSF